MDNKERKVKHRGEIEKVKAHMFTIEEAPPST